MATANPRHKPQQLQPVDQRLAAIERQLLDGKARMNRLADDVSENTRVTHEIRELTQEIRDLFEMGKSGMRVLNWLGRAMTKTAKWVGGMAAAGLAIWGAIYAFLHGGMPPK